MPASEWGGQKQASTISACKLLTKLAPSLLLQMRLTKTMILAAADVARVDLERTLSQVKAGANTHHTPMPHTTLYCSRRDWALGLSSVLRVLGCTVRVLGCHIIE